MGCIAIELYSPQQMSIYAIEVARRQPDDTWRWLIGDPFSVGKHAIQDKSSNHAKKDPKRGGVT